jgi:putative hydrolase of HD superfamily
MHHSQGLFSPNKISEVANSSPQEIKNMLAFLSLADNSKTILRHSWAPVPTHHANNLSEPTKLHVEKMTGYRRESNAEHSWRLALMAMLWSDKLDNKINKERAIQIAIVHDLGEVLAGDIPVHQQDANVKRKKELAELQAMNVLMATLTTKKEEHELYQFWLEYERQITPESKFIKAIDKLESFLKHNQDPIETWEPHEMRMLYQNKWLRSYCHYDSFLSKICEQIITDGIEKLKVAGINIEEIKKNAQEEEEKWRLETISLKC